MKHAVIGEDSGNYLAAFRGHQPQHRRFIGRKIFQSCEVSGPLIVVLQLSRAMSAIVPGKLGRRWTHVKGIHIKIVEDFGRDRIVATVTEMSALHHVSVNIISTNVKMLTIKLPRHMCTLTVRSSGRPLVQTLMARI